MFSCCTVATTKEGYYDRRYTVEKKSFGNWQFAYQWWKGSREDDLLMLCSGSDWCPISEIKSKHFVWRTRHWILIVKSRPAQFKLSTIFTERANWIEAKGTLNSRLVDNDGSSKCGGTKSQVTDRSRLVSSSSSYLGLLDLLLRIPSKSHHTIFFVVFPLCVWWIFSSTTLASKANEQTTTTRTRRTMCPWTDEYYYYDGSAVENSGRAGAGDRRRK